MLFHPIGSREGRILPTDVELVRRYCGGEERAFELLLMRHKRKVWSHIFLMVRDREVAEDLFQEAFIKVVHHLKAGKYNEEGKVPALGDADRAQPGDRPFPAVEEDADERAAPTNTTYSPTQAQPDRNVEAAHGERADRRGRAEADRPAAGRSRKRWW
jgi:hypothetical protein